MRLLIIPLTLCFLLASPTFAGQPSVRGVSFTPSNVRLPTQEDIEEARRAMIQIQEFYANEMRNHRSKTFKLEKNANDRVIIHEIRGEERWEKYSNLDLIRNEINKEFGYEVSKGGDEITIVFITGLKLLPNKDAGLHQAECSDDFICKNICYIPAESTDWLLITAHEIGHAFGLHHNPKSKNPKGKKFLMYKYVRSKSLNGTGLSADEARWLDCTKFFNDQNTVQSVPIITEVHEPQWFNRTIRLGFDVENAIPLHQVYLLSNDRMVLDYDMIKSRRLTVGLETTVSSTARFIDLAVKILDTHGNHTYYKFHFSKFGVPVMKLPLARAAPSMFVPLTVVGTWGDIKANR